MTETEEHSAGHFEVIANDKGIRFHKPAGDVLHDPVIEPQLPGCNEVLLGLPFGECGGVRMANQLIRTISDGSRAVYGNHEPTHGADSTAEFKRLGARFDLPPEEIPAGSTYVISAHGAAPEISRRATERHLRVLVVTCPLVRKTHLAVEKAAEEEDTIVAYISFGDSSHPELQGVIGLAEETGVPLTVISSPEDADELMGRLDSEVKVTVVGQTTNNSDEAQELAGYVGKLGAQGGIEVSREDANDVCHTVRDRQSSTRQIVRLGVDSLVVVGSVNSKNTLSLAKVAAAEALKTGSPLDIYLVNSWQQLPHLEGRVGVVSGASTLAENVEGVVARLNSPGETIQVGEDTDRGRMFKPSHPATREIISGLAS